MLKKTITYTDFNDEERTETFLFHLTKAEIIEMEMSTRGGLVNHLQRIVEEKDSQKIVKEFKDLILKSYGVKSDDGREFVKNQQLRDSFMCTEAYSVLFTELSTDASAAAAFVNGIIPKMPQ